MSNTRVISNTELQDTETIKKNSRILLVSETYVPYKLIKVKTLKSKNLKKSLMVYFSIYKRNGDNFQRSCHVNLVKHILILKHRKNLNFFKNHV